MKNIIILGTRPEIIKFAPLIKHPDSNFTIIHTGQHKELAEETFDIFDIKPDFDLDLMEENQDILEFMNWCAISLTEILKDLEERIWVEGDTMTAFVGALTGQDRTLVHLESGLRTNDITQPFPEEIFRIAIDNSSDVLLAPTKENVKNLKREKVKGKIFQTGNTIVDALKMVKLSDESPYSEKFILATVHRREAQGEGMKNIFKALKRLSEEIKVVVPVHPNPNVQKIANEVGLETIKPFGYKTFLNHLKHCEVVLTDSGGVQEEAPSFNTPVLVLRKKTERQELIQSNKGELVGWDEDRIVNRTIDLLNNNFYYEKDNKNPFGNGKATERIVSLEI